METIFILKNLWREPSCLSIHAVRFEYCNKNRGFMEQVCNFSTEEAVIREVWMGEKICLDGRGKMSCGERTNWVVLSSCSILDFLPGPGRNEWLCFVVIYIMLTWNYSLFFFFLQQERFSGTPTFYVTTPSEGARALTLSWPLSDVNFYCKFFPD